MMVCVKIPFAATLLLFAPGLLAQQSQWVHPAPMGTLCMAATRAGW